MRYLTLLFLLAAWSAVGAVLDPAARIALGHGPASHAPAHTEKAAENRPPFYPLILEITDEDAIPRLEALGAISYGRRDELLLTAVPTDALGELDGIPGIRSASLSRTASLNLDLARARTGADAAQAGAADFGPLDGSGVTVGFSDGGFDPTHPAFEGRVDALAYFAPADGVKITAVGPQEVAAWDSPTVTLYHATHVAGIMAGDPADAPQYRGVAPGATIVGTESDMSDVGILAGVDFVIARAAEQGRTPVVNLSLGNSTGPHDGTSAFARYLEKCAREAVIVLSAGNMGVQNMTVRHTFTDRPLICAIYSFHNMLDALDGYVDLWSADAAPVEWRLRLFRRGQYTPTWAGEWHSTADSPEGQIDETLPAPLPGQVSAAWEVNPANSRFNLMFYFRTAGTSFSDNAPYLPAIEFRAAPGTEIDICTDNDTRFYDTSPTPDGAVRGSALSISDLATGHGTISVGSLNTRYEVTRLGGARIDWTFNIGDGAVSRFSSWGRLRDGRTLPLLSAPGAVIVAPLSGLAVADYPDLAYDAVFRDASGAYYIDDSGTSMAAPHVAGVCALWLQADPTLTPADIRRIALETASPVDFGEADPTDALRVGAGCIDPVAGLRMIRAESGISDPADLPVSVTRRDGRIVVETFSDIRPRVEVYDLSGRTVRADALPSAPVVVRVHIPGAAPVTRLL